MDKMRKETGRGAASPLWCRVGLLASVLGAVGSAVAQDPELRFGARVPPEVETIYESGLSWLAQAQAPQGNWTDSRSGTGVDGLCVMAFLASGEDPNFGRYAPNIRRALRSMLAAQDPSTGYLPDSMYHHGFAMLALAEAYGAVDDSLIWREAGGEEAAGIFTLGEALEMAVKCAATSQTKNRWGGWRYSPDATDADTSVSGAVLMGLLAARNAGIEVADEVIDGALEYMRRSTGRNGSVAYSGGLGGMGESMNRSSIAALVLAVGRQKDSWEYEATMKHITSRLEHQESSYPEYFRYYMAQATFQGDYPAWQKWNSSTVRQLERQQQPDGSFNSSAYSTSMSLLALALNYRFLPIYER
jgi:hypothetical protein